MSDLPNPSIEEPEEVLAPAAADASAGAAGANGSAVGPDDPAAAEPAPDDAVTFESLLTDFERVTVERDDYLRLAQSKQAELENFRKRVMKQQVDEIARATGRLVEGLLPVLDAFDYASTHGEEALAPMRDQLFVALEKEGLGRIESDGAPFDPTVHDAVAHEPAGEGDDAAVVIETMRAGYTWQGQLLRPAMVKVRG